MSPNVPLDTVGVIGLGYIGLPTAAVLAQAGKTVIGVDVKQSSVDAINAGEVPFVEEGLEIRPGRSGREGQADAHSWRPRRPTPTSSPCPPRSRAITTRTSPTSRPPRSGIAPKLTGGELIVLESTAPPGATEHMAQVILDCAPGVHQRAEPRELPVLLPCTRARAARAAS